jgi:hypothetical protein
MSDTARDLNLEIAEELGITLPISPVWSEEEVLPKDWAHSVDLALELPIDIGGWVLTILAPEHRGFLGRAPYRAVLDAYNPKLKKSSYYAQSGQWTREAETLPEAICLAWLAYRKAVG